MFCRPFLANLFQKVPRLHLPSAVTLQPIQYVRIQPDRQLPFHRKPGHDCLLDVNP